MESQSTGKRTMSDDLEPVLVRVEKTNPNTRNIHIDKDEFKIGRGRDNDMVIAHVSISRNHCIFRRTESGEWTVEDVSSSGTILNCVKLERGKPETISVGDSIKFSPSNEFLYTFILAVKTEPKAKRPRMMEHSELEEIISKQKTFAELQQCERRELAKKLEAQHIEQEKRKLELEKLLKDQRTSSGEKDYLNKQIDELKRNIEVGNIAESNLEKLNQELSERLEKERQEFEMKLNEEKQKMQAALEMSRQEKETLEAMMREQMERLQAEKKKIQESLTEEKNTEQAKLLDENNVLVQKLKEMEEVLRQKEASTEELRNTLEKEKAKAAEVIVVDSMMDTLTTNCTAQELQLLDTIDLTIDSPSVSKLGVARPQETTKEDVFNTVGDIMDEQLTCSVCSELFVTAITLNCTHTFCQHCINTWIKKKKECPVCRSPISAMNRSLVLDNFIDKMVENLSVEHKNHRREIIDERRATEAKEKKAEEKQKKQQRQPSRGRGRGTGANANTGRAANPQTGATSRTNRNARPRESHERRDRVHHRGREFRTSPSTISASREQPSTTGSTSRAQGSVPTSSTAHSRPQDDSDDSSSTSSDSDSDENTDSSRSNSSRESDPEGSEATDNQSSQSDWESRGTDGTDVWSDFDDPMGFDDNSDDFWGEDDYVDGVPGSYYGGYGSCYVCGNRGHWAPGCPFK